MCISLPEAQVASEGSLTNGAAKAAAEAAGGASQGKPLPLPFACMRALCRDVGQPWHGLPQAQPVVYTHPCSTLTRAGLSEVAQNPFHVHSEGVDRLCVPLPPWAIRAGPRR